MTWAVGIAELTYHDRGHVVWLYDIHDPEWGHNDLFLGIVLDSW